MGRGSQQGSASILYGNTGSRGVAAAVSSSQPQPVNGVVKLPKDPNSAYDNLYEATVAGKGESGFDMAMELIMDEFVNEPQEPYWDVRASGEDYWEIKVVDNDDHSHLFTISSV